MVNLWERYPVLGDYVHNARAADIARSDFQPGEEYHGPLFPVLAGENSQD